VAERPLPVVVVTLARTGAVVARADVADTADTRRRGLLGRDGLAPGTGLLIRPCGAIHTWFMRFPIDAVFLRRDGTVTRVRVRIGPFRLAWGGWRADDTLELPAGAAAAAGIEPGDRLVIEPA
jgi:hypothetical protein